MAATGDMWCYFVEGWVTRHAGRGLEVLLALVRPGRRQGGSPFPASSAVRESDKSATTVAASPGHCRRRILRGRRLPWRGTRHTPAAGREAQLQEQAPKCPVAVADALREGVAEGTTHQVGDEHHVQWRLVHDHDHGQDASRTGLHRGAPKVPQQISKEQKAHTRQCSVSENNYVIMQFDDDVALSRGLIGPSTYLT